MGELLKNVRVAGGAMAGIGVLVAIGVYQPDDQGAALIVTVVGALGGGAIGALVAAWKKRKEHDAAGPGA